LHLFAPLLHQERRLGARLDAFGNHSSPRLCAMTMSERTMAASFVVSVILPTKLRSILMRESGKRVR